MARKFKFMKKYTYFCSTSVSVECPGQAFVGEYTRDGSNIEFSDFLLRV